MAHRLQIFRSMTEARPVWRQLEASGAGTAFQTYRWHDAWSRHVGPARGERPLIVAGSDADGVPQLLLPLSTQTIRGASVLGWHGQSHTTYAQALIAPGAGESLTREAIQESLALVRTSEPGLSALQLRSQPVAWAGVANPFAGLATTPSANRSYVVALTPGEPGRLVSALNKSTRGKLKRSAKRFAELPGYQFEGAADTQRRLAILDQFFAQKARQFAERGIVDPFQEPGVAAFYRDLATDRPDAPALVECSALHAEGAMMATATSISFGSSRHLLTLSLGTMPAELLKLSPGLTLMQLLMEQASADGMSAYDLGAGDGQHKTIWQPEPVDLVDAYIPLGIAGYAVTLTASGGTLAKRLIKSNKRLWQVAQRARKLLRASGL